MKCRAAKVVELTSATKMVKEGLFILEKARMKRGQNDITADVKWRLSKGNGGLYHNENKHDSYWG